MSGNYKALNIVKKKMNKRRKRKLFAFVQGSTFLVCLFDKYDWKIIIVYIAEFHFDFWRKYF